MKRIAERALNVTDADIRGYQPSSRDVEIAEVLLSGTLSSLSFAAIADELGCTAPVISARLKNGITCAWIYKMVHEQITHRLGMVDAAMFARATAGDVRAATLIFTRYGKLVDRRHVHITGSFDPTQLSDEDLDRLITRHESNKAQDAEFTKETP